MKEKETDNKNTNTRRMENSMKREKTIIITINKIEIITASKRDDDDDDDVGMKKKKNLITIEQKQ